MHKKNYNRKNDSYCNVACERKWTPRHMCKKKSAYWQCPKVHPMSGVVVKKLRKKWETFDKPRLPPMFPRDAFSSSAFSSNFLSISSPLSLLAQLIIYLFKIGISVNASSYYDSFFFYQYCPFISVLPKTLNSKIVLFYIEKGGFFVRF